MDPPSDDKMSSNSKNNVRDIDDIISGNGINDRSNPSYSNVKSNPTRQDNYKSLEKSCNNNDWNEKSTSTDNIGMEKKRKFEMPRGLSVIPVSRRNLAPKINTEGMNTDADALPPSASEIYAYLNAGKEKHCNWEPQYVHTTKCDRCHEHNTNVVQRCISCNMQFCIRCIVAGTRDGIHEVFLPDLDWNPLPPSKRRRSTHTDAPAYTGPEEETQNLNQSGTQPQVSQPSASVSGKGSMNNSSREGFGRDGRNTYANAPTYTGPEEDTQNFNRSRTQPQVSHITTSISGRGSTNNSSRGGLGREGRAKPASAPVARPGRLNRPKPGGTVGDAIVSGRFGNEYTPGVRNDHMDRFPDDAPTPTPPMRNSYRPVAAKTRDSTTIAVSASRESSRVSMSHAPRRNLAQTLPPPTSTREESLARNRMQRTSMDTAAVAGTQRSLAPIVSAPSSTPAGLSARHSRLGLNRPESRTSSMSSQGVREVSQDEWNRVQAEARYKAMKDEAWNSDPNILGLRNSGREDEARELLESIDQIVRREMGLD